jgi:hypothetical protein
MTMGGDFRTRYVIPIVIPVTRQGVTKTSSYLNPLSKGYLGRCDGYDEV